MYCDSNKGRSRVTDSVDRDCSDIDGGGGDGLAGEFDLGEAASFGEWGGDDEGDMLSTGTLESTGE